MSVHSYPCRIAPVLSDTAALVLDPEVVEEVAEKYDGTPLGYCASTWLYTYSAALDLGFSEDTARRQAAAAWDANRGALCALCDQPLGPTEPYVHPACAKQEQLLEDFHVEETT